MTAGKYDIYIEQGATYEQDVYWRSNTTPPVPITVQGYTAKMQIRATVTSPSPLLTLMTNPPPPQVGSDDNTTPPDGQILLGDIDGRITLYLSASTTLGLTWTTGVYDLNLVSPNGYITRVLQGNVTVSPGVTDI